MRCAIGRGPIPGFQSYRTFFVSRGQLSSERELRLVSEMAAPTSSPHSNVYGTSTTPPADFTAGIEPFPDYFESQAAAAVESDNALPAENRVAVGVGGSEDERAASATVQSSSWTTLTDQDDGDLGADNGRSKGEEQNGKTMPTTAPFKNKNQVTDFMQ